MQVLICPICHDTAAPGLGFDTCPECGCEMKEIDVEELDAELME